MFPFVTFIRDFRCFQAFSVIDFHPDGTTLLVGDQGGGKSTLLGQLSLVVSKSRGERYDEKVLGVTTDDISILTSWNGDPAPVSYFDFERNNPRTSPAFGMFGIDIGTQVSSMYGSHGEFVRGSLSEIDRAQKGTLLLDEPDMALSPRSIHTLVQSIRNAEKRGVQVIAAVHNPLLIASFAEVLSLEHGRWMRSWEFLESQTEPSTMAKGPRRIQAFYGVKTEPKAEPVAGETP